MFKVHLLFIDRTKISKNIKMQLSFDLSNIYRFHMTIFTKTNHGIEEGLKFSNIPYHMDQVFQPQCN